MSGFFLAVEGVDGVGKSTLLAGLRERFEAAGREVIVVREPGGTPLGEAVRNLLLRDAAIPIGAEAQMLLFLASRVQLWEEHIASTLAKGAVVLSDRFYLSTIVYQGIAGELGEARATEVCHTVLGDRRPDLHLILELSEAEAARRRAERADEEPDRFEEKQAFLEKVRAGFETTVGIPGDRIERLSAEGDRETVLERVWKVVERVAT